MFATPSRHQGYAVNRTRVDGVSQYGRKAPVRCCSRASRLANTGLASASRTASKSRSAGFNAGLYAGNLTGLSPAGHCTCLLIWLPLLSSTKAIGPAGKARRNSRKNTSKHAPSSCGRHQKKLSPVVGSMAAYSQSHSYRSSTIQGGRTPLGHHRRRNHTFKPKRASSMAKARVPWWCASLAPKSFFKSSLGLRIVLAVAAAASLALDFLPLEQL
jgi:hypothetical protein